MVEHGKGRDAVIESKFYINYEQGVEDGVPQQTMDGLRGYIEDGNSPGGFLTSVLENDLTGAVCRADLKNTKALTAIVKWVYNVAPARCWGNEDKVETWLNCDWLAHLTTSKENS